MIIAMPIIFKLILFFAFIVFNVSSSNSDDQLSDKELELYNKIVNENTNSDTKKYGKEVFAPVIDSLLKRGVDKEYIMKLVNSEKTAFNDKYVKINVTGYLKSSDHSHNYSSKSVEKSKEFLKNNDSLLKAAAKKYEVSKEVIVAILWVETKFGTYVGNNHLPSVFLSTALVNEPKFVQLNINEIDSTKYSKAEYKKLVDKIKQRSIKKSNWALEELIAMYEIEKQNRLNFDIIYGSWAGAFGFSQFLPSSYNKWAVDGNNDNIINLFEVEDAVHSVANYLKVHGWDNNNQEKQRKAVFAYNNSTSYVNSVLKLAEKIKK